MHTQWVCWPKRNLYDPTHYVVGGGHFECLAQMIALICGLTGRPMFTCSLSAVVRRVFSRMHWICRRRAFALIAHHNNYWHNLHANRLEASVCIECAKQFPSARKQLRRVVRFSTETASHVNRIGSAVSTACGPTSCVFARTLGGSI